jgi:hypothetical protein
MTIKQSNYVPGRRCYWLHKSTMALLHIGGTKLAGCDATALFFKKQENPENFIRVYVEPVRTKRDTARQLAAFRRAKKKFMAALAKHVKEGKS